MIIIYFFILLSYSNTISFIVTLSLTRKYLSPISRHIYGSSLAAVDSHDAIISNIDNNNNNISKENFHKLPRIYVSGHHIIGSEICLDEGMFFVKISFTCQIIFWLFNREFTLSELCYANKTRISIPGIQSRTWRISWSRTRQIEIRSSILFDHSTITPLFSVYFSLSTVLCSYKETANESTSWESDWDWSGWYCIDIHSKQ